MTSVRSRLGVRSGFAVLLWLAALVVPALMAVHLVSPVRAVVWAQRGAAVISTAAAIATGVAILLLIAWPPFVPGLRVAWRALKGRMSVPQGPMLGALERLRHLETAKDHLIVARARIDMGDWRGSLPHLLRGVELEPELLDARALLGRALLRLGAVSQAIAQLEMVVARDPEHGFGSTLLDLGRALELAERDEQAERSLAEHEERFGPNRDADLARARIARRAGNKEATRGFLERAARPLEGVENSRPEDALARARARVALWRGGGA